MGKNHHRELSPVWITAIELLFELIAAKIVWDAWYFLNLQQQEIDLPTVSKYVFALTEWCSDHWYLFLLLVVI